MVGRGRVSCSEAARAQITGTWSERSPMASARTCPGDATLMTKLEDVDFTQFTQNDFWFAHLKNDGEGGISCALTTFA